ncbi:MAG: PEP-CTERM sorting domain-containing protein [Verrucomicrobia bacterium]|nr:PEP-CTERM sorting domain-containing protein [Verrucomicrobiota bacterium]MDA1204681.1 PEP-CTERM sorting domain-containing protein [Verrucomicrobiota bacterium]
MKKPLLLTLVTAALAVSSSFAAEGTTSPYTDAVDDIDAEFGSAADGTLNILGMEVSNNSTDITFTLSVNGNISSTDWGNFMIGLATGGTGTTTGNAWARPINLSSPIGGMDYWVGSWVNSGGGSQLWSFDGASWTNTGALPGYSFSPGATSSITYTATLASLGLAVNDVFYFDAYSSGGGGGDSAVDALANPNVSVTQWGQTYTSSTTGSGGVGLNSYQVVPEPSTYALLTLGALGVAGYAAGRRARK